MTSNAAQSSPPPPLPQPKTPLMSSPEYLAVVKEIEEERKELAMLRNWRATMSVVIWNLVRQAYPETHETEVPTVPSDPLWQLAFVQPSDGSSAKTRILAGTIKPIAEQEKKRVVRLLRGTTTPMHIALSQLELERFPPSYVEEQISAYLKWEPVKKDELNPTGAQGSWHSVSRPFFGERLKNFACIPKS